MGAGGYSFAEISPNVNPNMEERTASIILTIQGRGDDADPSDQHQWKRRRPRTMWIRREIRVDEQDVIDTPR